VVSEVRNVVDAASLGVSEVFHYSIPVLDETGDGRIEPVSEIGSGKLRLGGGEVLISKLNPRLPRVLVAEPHAVPTISSTEFIALRPGPDLETRYLVYALQSMQTRQFLDGATMSVTRSQQRVRPEVLTKSWWEIPDRATQRAIAKYLDAETARIDALIAKKQQMIERFLDRRVSTTILGVAGGWISSGRVQSRLPWLESLPEHWRIAKLTLVAGLGSGHTPSRSRPDWWIDCTIPWVTTGEVAAMRSDRLEYVEETREKVSEEGLANSAAVVHPAGTVVLCRTASAGYSAIMATDMATSQDFATWTCGPLLRPRYLLLCLRAMREDLLGRLAMGSTHKTIYMPDIEAIRVPLPPVDEQDRIIEQVWQQLRRIDRIVDTTERQIGLLREHRQALITAAVTGEIEIPGVAA
jgi:type I restriction enzyme S subunit